MAFNAGDAKVNKHNLGVYISHFEILTFEMQIIILSLHLIESNNSHLRII